MNHKQLNRVDRFGSELSSWFQGFNLISRGLAAALLIAALPVLAADYSILAKDSSAGFSTMEIIFVLSILFGVFLVAVGALLSSIMTTTGISTW